MYTHTNWLFPEDETWPRQFVACEIIGFGKKNVSTAMLMTFDAGFFCSILTLHIFFQIFRSVWYWGQWTYKVVTYKIWQYDNIPIGSVYLSSARKKLSFSLSNSVFSFFTWIKLWDGTHVTGHHMMNLSHYLIHIYKCSNCNLLHTLI